MDVSHVSLRRYSICDLHEKDMSRKQRDAFRCTGW